MIQDSLRERVELHARLADILPGQIQPIADILIRSLRNGGKILFCGNGGSAADSQHLAAELVGRFERERRGLPALSLTTDSSILTSVGNDYGFDRIFERQVEALGRPGDALAGISTSGRSKNVVLAMQKARAMGLSTIAFCGETPGPVTELADAALRIPATRTVLIQEGHIVAGHILCDLIEAAFSSGVP
jgi:D-sedoheptulose 7-phosphate isomerase